MTLTGLLAKINPQRITARLDTSPQSCRVLQPVSANCFDFTGLSFTVLVSCLQT